MLPAAVNNFELKNKNSGLKSFPEFEFKSFPDFIYETNIYI
jgi:hypothetical protein